MRLFHSKKWRKREDFFDHTHIDSHHTRPTQRMDPKSHRSQSKVAAAAAFQSEHNNRNDTRTDQRRNYHFSILTAKSYYGMQCLVCARLVRLGKTEKMIIIPRKFLVGAGNKRISRVVTLSTSFVVG